MKQAILAALFRIAPHLTGEESEVEYQQRMEVIADSIDRASQGEKDVAAFLLMTAEGESNYVRRIHAGNCRKDECDGGRAVSLWQFWRLADMPQAQFDAMVGVGRAPTRLAAAYAARLYRMKRNYCKGRLGAINAYATGKCFPKGYDGRKRLRRMEEILGTLQ